MKHSIKKDLFLKELYKYKFDGKHYSLQSIAEDAGLDALTTEIVEICQSLDSMGLVKLHLYKGGGDIKISSYGVEYCESDSFTFHNKALITTNYISIINSPSSTIVNGSENIQINTISGLQESLEKVCASIQIASELDEDIQLELLERVSEIKEQIDASSKIPKYGIRDLINLGASSATLAQYLEPLKQFIQ